MIVRSLLALTVGLLLGHPAARAETGVDVAMCEKGRLFVKRNATTIEELAVLIPGLGPQPPGARLMRWEPPDDQPKGERYYQWDDRLSIDRAKTYCRMRHHKTTKPRDGTYAFTVAKTSVEGCEGARRPDFSALAASRRLKWPTIFTIEPIVAAVPIKFKYEQISEWVWRANGQPKGVPKGTVFIVYEARATGRNSFDLTAQVDLMIANRWCIGRAEMKAKRVSP